MVSQVSELAAVQEQVLGAVTVIDPVLAVELEVIVEAESVAHAVSYETVTLSPALEAELTFRLSSE